VAERDAPDETKDQRLDRNFGELLNELRIALPGVQVLFAFLLVAPFNQGFTKVSGFERKLYFATLLTTALSTILLIALPMQHRLLFRQHEREYLVTLGNRLALAGLTCLALSMTCAVTLITHYLYGGIASAVLAASMTAAFVGIWYWPGISRRAQARRPLDP